MSQSPLIITPQEAFDRDWPIIPCAKTKIPMLTSWKIYQTRLPTVEEFEKWNKLNPPAWALITGALSGRITLDFDGDNGRQTFEQLRIPAHRKTPSGGFHIDFHHPGLRVGTLNGKSSAALASRFPGMDVRGDGGYVLFYGETDRGSYSWLRDPEPHEIQLIPAELRQFMGLIRTAEVFISRALTRVSSEGRNVAGFWLASQLRDNGFEQTQAVAAMSQYRAECPIVNRKGEPEEYTEAEVLASINQAYGQPAREPWAIPNKSTAGPILVNGHSETEPESSPAIPIKNKHFLLSKSGVFHVDEETGSKIFVCSHLEVVAYARDPNSEAWGRLLKWKDPKQKEHSWIVPMRMLVGDGVSVRETLADGGLEIGTSTKTNHLLSEYIRLERPQIFMCCVPWVGWFDRSFVFPEDTIPENAAVGYQSQGRGEHFYRTAGTLESWQEEIGRKCVGNSRLILAVSAAFAGPLLRPLNIQGGGFHFRSASSAGKSTTQYVAGSVWGGGGPNGFARTWAATKSASESTAELHNDGCLILDEMRLIDPREMEQIVYMLANGSGKSRENRNLTGRRTLQWRLMIISSGEITLADCAMLAGQKMRGGAEIRMATIPADAERGLGLFEELHGTDNPGVFAETLEAAAKRNYGIPIRIFIRYLIEHWEAEISTPDGALKWIEDFIQHHIPKDAPPEVRRVLRRFAAVACAGELATDAGITGWEPGTASQAAADCFDAWLIERGGLEATDVRNAIQQVRQILASQHDRFYPADPEMIKDDRGNERLAESQHIHNALGYWKMIGDELIYLVNRDAFELELCRGFSPKDVCKALQKYNYMKIVERDRFTYKAEVTLPTGERLGIEHAPRFYGIRGAIVKN